MRDQHGTSVELTKSFTWREQSETVVVTYSVDEETHEFEELSDDIRHLLGSVEVSYIHPQEGAELLQKAQDKFKKRLFHNWGRHASVSERLSAVQQQWDELRTTANTYLSRALTERIRALWPGSEIKVDLPARLEDVVAISEIAFRGAANLPELSLTAHGTGAQSSILYQTHFILDSDRSLHQGMYFPVWLLEEPESFLHADIAFQLGRLLASSEWQAHIQMFISTHSPIILAGSRQNPETNRWILFEKHEVTQQVQVGSATEETIAAIGTMMGDANFGVYFEGAGNERVVLIEDSRDRTESAFVDAGVPVTRCLGGISEVKKYLNVYLGVAQAVSAETIFIVDGDRGLREIDQILSDATILAEQGGWSRYQLSDNLFVITLPRGYAVEDLFDEWDAVLEETLDDLLNPDMSIRDNIPARLSRVLDPLRRRPPSDREEARDQIRSLQDVKDRFWHRAGEEGWSIAAAHEAALQGLLA